MPFTLSRYIGKHVAINILTAFAIVLAIAGLIDLVEMFRRTAGKEGVTLWTTLHMVTLRLPHLAEKLLPYSILIGAMMALIKLSRSSELVVVRSAGVSVWRFLLPGVIIAFLIGLASLMLLNPLSSATLGRYELLEARYINGAQQVFSVSSSGLWLRQQDTGNARIGDTPIGSYIMQAGRITQTDMTFSDVVIFLHDAQGRFIGRIDAERAQLGDGYWTLDQAMISIPGEVPDMQARYILPTNLDIQQIQDSFAEPRTLSFWQLSGFISTLENAGFSAIRHKVHWYSLLLTPLIFCAMVLVAAVFSLRQPRRGKTTLMVFGAVVTGFVLNFLTGLFHAFGYAGNLPVEIAVVAPHLLAVMASMVVLLHVEDG